MSHITMDSVHTAPCTRQAWGCQRLATPHTRALRRLQRRCKPVARPIRNSSQTSMRMAGSQTQPFPTIGPKLTSQDIINGYNERSRSMDPQMLETLKEMMVVRRKVMARPGMLALLVKQMRTASIDEQLKATEMVFCVVGQGPARDPMTTREAMNLGLLPSILGAMQDILNKPGSTVRQDTKLQALLKLLLSMLAQLTVETEGDDVTVAQAVTAQGGVKMLHRLFPVLTGDNSQQNLVSMLWHWTTLDEDIRQKILDEGIAELQVELLGPKHSMAQRIKAAEQLTAFVTVPDQRAREQRVPQQQQPQPEQDVVTEFFGDARLASNLVYCGAPMPLVSMLKQGGQHESIRSAAAHALAALATCAPDQKMKIMAAGVFEPLVAMLSKSEPENVREMGAVLMVTLLAGEPKEATVHAAVETAVQFASYGAIPPLVEMLDPVNPPGTRMVAMTALHILAHTFDDRIKKALVGAGIIEQAMEITGMLTGRLDFDPSFNDIEMPAILDLKMKSAEILAMIAVDNPENTKLLVQANAIEDMVLATSSDDIPDEQKQPLMRMLANLCGSSEEVLGIITTMMNQ